MILEGRIAVDARYFWNIPHRCLLFAFTIARTCNKGENSSQETEHQSEGKKEGEGYQHELIHSSSHKLSETVGSKHVDQDPKYKEIVAEFHESLDSALLLGIECLVELITTASSAPAYIMSIAVGVNCEHIDIGGRHEDVSEKSEDHFTRIAVAVQHYGDCLTQDHNSNWNSHYYFKRVRRSPWVRGDIRDLREAEEEVEVSENDEENHEYSVDNWNTADLALSRADVNGEREKESLEEKKQIQDFK